MANDDSGSKGMKSNAAIDGDKTRIVTEAAFRQRRAIGAIERLPSHPHSNSSPPTNIDPTPSLAMLRAARETGTKTVFTVPGGPLMPFLRACRDEGFEIIVCRQETNALIAACGHYYATRVPAIVALTSGPGAANAVNGCLHALREHAAVLIVSARPSGPKLGRGAVQDLDTAALFCRLTKASEQLIHPEQASPLTRHLLATAVAPNPGPVNLTVACHQW